MCRFLWGHEFSAHLWLLNLMVRVWLVLWETAEPLPKRLYHVAFPLDFKKHLIKNKQNKTTPNSAIWFLDSFFHKPRVLNLLNSPLNQFDHLDGAPVTKVNEYSTCAHLNVCIKSHFSLLKNYSLTIIASNISHTKDNPTDEP